MKYIFSLLLTIFSSLAAVAQVTMPTSRAVFQRDLTNRALIPIEGQGAGSATTLQARATPLNGGTAVDWTTVGGVSNGSFAGKLSLTAGWYQLDIRVLNGSSVLGSWTVDRVGVGEVIVVAGQSNAQGFPDGPDATDDRVSCTNAVNGDIREYQFAFSFRHLDGSVSVGPTNNKQFYGALGDLLVRRLNVPVLILGAAIGGTSSDQYAGSALGQLDVADSQLWDGQQELRPYRAIQATLNHYARRTGLRGIFWFQGESDNGRTSTSNYINNISTIINKSRSDLGYTIPWVISQTSWINGSTDGNITAAQRQLVNQVSTCFSGPNTDAYGSNYRLSDNTHFAPSSMSLLASIWNDALPNSFFQTAPFTLSDVPPTVTAAVPSPARQYAGGHIWVGYMATGPAAGASYTVQLLNESGGFITNLGSASTNPIRVFLPTSLSGNYRVQVVSSVTGNVSSPSEKFQVYQNGLGTGSGTGLTASYYPNTTLSGSPVVTRTEGPLDYTWVNTPGSSISVDNRNWTATWTGKLEAPSTGNYTIKSVSDDGSQVWINGQLVINDWSNHPWAIPQYGSIYLEAGKRYDIKVALYQADNAAQVRLLWMLPGQDRSQYIPIDRLYPVVTTPQAPVLTGTYSLLQLSINQQFSYSLPALFSDPAGLNLTYQYSNLPAGLSGNGLTLSGSPSTGGTGTFTLKATNSAGLSATAQVPYMIQTVDSPATNPLVMAAPSYDCSTGAITFKTTGGNGSLIEFMASGITGWTSNPNQYLDKDARTASDTPPFIIYYRQSGVTASYTWSRQASCSGTPTTPITTTTTNPPTPPTPPVPTTTTTGGTLSATVVSYNCSTGQIVLGSTGGNGSAVEFMASGITGWTTQPATTLDYCGAHCTDTPPFVIHVRQNGVEGKTYTWSRQAYCSGTVTPPTTTTTTPPTTTTVTPPTTTTTTTTTPPTTTGGTLSATVVSYNCSTGQIVLGSIGGNGSAVEFMASGITGWTTQPATTLDYCGAHCTDTPPFVIHVRQNGVEGKTYTWSRQAYCSGTVTPPTTTTTTPPTTTTTTPPTTTTTTPPTTTGGTLSATVVSYNCSTGQIVLGSTGGNGSAVEFMAVGITGWSANPVQYLDKDARVLADTPPFVIHVRQNGVEGKTYTWSRQAYCSVNARTTLAEIDASDLITVFPNPATDKVQLRVPEALRETNLAIVINSLTGIQQACAVDDSQRAQGLITIDVFSLPKGLYLLQLTAPAFNHSVKLLKQ